MRIKGKWAAVVALVAVVCLATSGVVDAKGKPSRGPTDLKLVAEGTSTVSALFNVDDVRAAWPAWHSGSVPDMIYLGYGSMFGASDQQTLAADASGNVFVIYQAREDEDETTVLMENSDGQPFETDIYSRYETGIALWNAASDTFTSVFEAVWSYPIDTTPQLLNWDRYVGQQIYSVSVVPVGATKLPAGNLVLTRWVGPDPTSESTPDDRLEVVLLDPSNGDEQVLHSWPCGYHPGGTTDITYDGVIYVQGGDTFDDEARGEADRVHAEVFRLVPSESGGVYSVTAELLSNAVGLDGGVAAGPFGEVYSHTDNNGNGDGDIFVYDPAASSPSWSDYAGYRQATCCLEQFNAFAFDVDGAFWLAGRDSRQNANYISQVFDGGTASWTGRVATGMYRGIRCIEADPADGLLVLHDDYQQDSSGYRSFVTTTIYGLIPGAVDSGGGGGGNGNGKGKNK